MDSKEFDKLFREGLDQTFSFDGREAQWQQLASQLPAEEPKRRKLWLWWSLGLVIALPVVSWGIWYSNNPSATPSQPTTELAIEGQHQTTNEQTDAAVLSVQQQASPADDYKTAQKSKSADINLGNESSRQLVKTGLQNKATDAVSPPASMPLYEYPTSAPVSNTPPTAADLLEDNQLPSAGITSDQDLPALSNLTDINASTLAPLATLLSEVQPGIRPLPASPALTDKKPLKLRSIALQIGAQASFSSDQQITEEAGITPYFGVAVRIAPSWRWTIRYSGQSLRRTTSQEPASYNIPLVEVPVGFDTPNQTDLQYHQRQFETGLQYRLPLRSKLRLQAQIGLQLAQQRDIEAVYAYENIYQQPVVRVALPQSPWHISTVFGAVEIALPLSQRWSVHSSYQRYQSVSSEYYRWRNLHLLSTGLQYQF